MKVSKVLAFAAGSYFLIAFVKDGTLSGLVKDGERATQRVLKGGQRIVRRTV